MRHPALVFIFGLTACSGGESDSFPLVEATGGAASDGGTGGEVGDGDSSGGHENADGGSDPGGTGGESDGGTGGGELASGGASGGEASGGNGSGGDATGGTSGWSNDTPECAPLPDGCDDTNYKSYCTDYGITGAFPFACTGTVSPSPGCVQSPKDPGLDRVAWCCPQICQPTPMWSDSDLPFGFRCVSGKVPNDISGCEPDETYVNDVLNCSIGEPDLEEEYCEIPDPCDPPEILDQWTSSGNDVNNVCGWTAGTAPYGYAASSERACDSITASSHFPTMADEDGIWQSPLINIIDPGDRCEEELGSDRTYRTVGYYCLRATSPFSFQASGWFDGDYAWGAPVDECVVLNEGAALYESTVSELRVNMDEVGWIQIEVAAAPGGVCPLTCD